MEHKYVYRVKEREKAGRQSGEVPEYHSALAVTLFNVLLDALTLRFRPGNPSLFNAFHEAPTAGFYVLCA